MKAAAAVAVIAVLATAFFLQADDAGQQEIKTDTGIEETLVSHTYSWVYERERYVLTAEFSQSEYLAARAENRGTVTLSSYADYIDCRSVSALAESLAEYTDDTPAFILSFVQSLEYIDDYESTGYQEYPKYPIETLVDGGGDCEDVAALYSSLMGALGYDTALIYIPTSATTAHMVSGIAGDFTGAGLYDSSRTKYFIAECTARWEIGDVPQGVVFDPELCLVLKGGHTLASDKIVSTNHLPIDITELREDLISAGGMR
ncbi:hypothetical protein A3207_00740 [Candidatus Methanomassiliicoccus intestinalis]|uniref:Transglutaminase-like domain-containing protein n=3 Tax=Candidatus Methanomassiliicoccus intestinalis TaxID=1406512 RepID=R9TAB3_METII|nr:hypothetical protein [Candidatus Methanomassiliicoccus intestinalis]AGN26323.1 hypothetical protein MMINT_09680 [Candidatus Methanomassiliicoccus intestinalis Issoire-Mx1]TQS84603.1 MAG: hypothetical protein A3207_00740 [Candidatus Methanomassiliicoccus intestinalis]